VATSLFSAPELTGSLSFGEVRIGIVVATWNAEITETLCNGAVQKIEEVQLSHQHKIAYDVIQVPGAFEIPSAAQWLFEHNYHAVICIGCIIKGDTPHFEYVSNAVTNGVAELALKFSKPCIFGVLTVNTVEQAWERAGGKLGNKGSEAAEAALWMLETKFKIKHS